MSFLSLLIGGTAGLFAGVALSRRKKNGKKPSCPVSDVSTWAMQESLPMIFVTSRTTLQEIPPQAPNGVFLYAVTQDRCEVHDGTSGQWTEAPDLTKALSTYLDKTPRLATSVEPPLSRPVP